MSHDKNASIAVDSRPRAVAGARSVYAEQLTAPKRGTVRSNPKAYSYVRFSTPEQAKGDSLRRQTDRARIWATGHGLEMDETLTFEDKGVVSAYWGKNAADGALAAFLEAVKEGRVLKGSYLIIENLDRISRQAVRKAVRTLEDIVEAGVNVVDLEDGSRVYGADTLDDHTAFLIMVIRFMRANQESVLKGTAPNSGPI